MAAVEDAWGESVFGVMDTILMGKAAEYHSACALGSVSLPGSPDWQADPCLDILLRARLLGEQGPVIPSAPPTVTLSPSG
ncbi:MAG: hypothetical protein CML67_06385 [Rhodobacteraceae bacterium]|nr:hypothetical protein [Paracoccaceae bacterium]